MNQSFNALGNAAHTYVAYVAPYSTSRPPAGAVAVSNQVPLTPVAWSVSLTQSGGWVDPGELIVFRATANQSVTGTNKVLQIFDATSNIQLTWCSTGLTCQVTVTAASFPVHRIVAVVANASNSYPPPGVVATSNVIGIPTTFDVEALFGSSPQSATALDPVNVATGNFFESHTDLAFPAHVRGLAWTRTYNSRDRRITALGRGWSVPYTAMVVMTSSGAVELRADDGRLLAFTPVTGGGYASPTGFPATLTRAADGTFLLDDHHGSTTTFDTDGAVTRLDFPDSTRVDVLRALGRPATVTSSTGHSFGIGYDTAGRVATVTSDDGRTTSYSYTGTYLTGVTAPDGSVMHYAYDAAGRLTTMTDGAGHVTVTNAYDSLDRVVSQQTAPGQAVSFAYSDDATRTTTVTEPGATTMYTHDAFGRVTRIVDSLGHAADLTYGGTG